MPDGGHSPEVAAIPSDGLKTPGLPRPAPRRAAVLSQEPPGGEGHEDVRRPAGGGHSGTGGHGALEGGGHSSGQSSGHDETRRLASRTKAPRVPKYLELKEWLLRGMLDGRFRPGTALPSENELSQQFQVSRITVRQALDLLRAGGLVSSHQGKGYFVRNISAMQDLGRLQGFGEMMEPLGVDTRSQVLSAAVVEAPAKVARALNVKRGDGVVKIERLRIAAGVTLSVDLSYFPLDVGRPLLDLDLQRVDIFKLIETDLGIEIGFADITMSVVEAGVELCAPVPAVDLPFTPGAPVIHIERLTYAMDGRPIDFESLYAPAGSHRFKARIPRW